MSQLTHGFICVAGEKKRRRVNGHLSIQKNGVGGQKGKMYFLLRQKCGNGESSGWLEDHWLQIS